MKRKKRITKKFQVKIKKVKKCFHKKVIELGKVLTPPVSHFNPKLFFSYCENQE